MPQCKGFFGFDNEHAFDVPFTKNPKGGMNAESHREWARELRSYYPKAANRPRHRVMTKSDTGPGRMDADFLSEHRIEGFCHFPSLPNGTEIGAEMDQLFAYFKTIIYDNMEKIWLKKCQVEGPNASITDEDLVCCVFGLDVYFKNGDVLSGLVNAFSEALSREKTIAARDKVGYAPASQDSLKSEKLRHEAVLDESGDPILDLDPLGALTLGIQKDNHEAIRCVCENIVFTLQMYACSNFYISRSLQVAIGQRWIR